MLNVIIVTEIACILHPIKL